MAKCPKCGEEISSLIHIQVGVMESRYDGEIYEELEFYSDYKTNGYECPECRKTITHNEEEAKQILNI